MLFALTLRSEGLPSMSWSNSCRIAAMVSCKMARLVT